MGTTGSESGSFVISLDFELMWGVRDHATRESYGPNVMGGREAIPAMLDLFHRRSVKATWATVGALLCESKDELLARATQEEAGVSPIAGLDDVGADERRDPYYFGASLARLIASCDGQEIGTHTFSHRCALEPGETVRSFAADVATGLAQLKEWRIDCRSIVFPRNQYGPAQLEACRALGLSHFRGNERAWFYAPTPSRAQTKARRLCRLADSYINLSGANVSQPVRGEKPLTNVPASRFLRPFDRRLSPFDTLRLRRIETAMRDGAESGGTFHLWWHPENFGRNLKENMTILTMILDQFERLRAEHGMQSRAMQDLPGPVPARSTSMPSKALAS